MHRDARPCRRWRPYGSPPYSSNLSNLANFGCLSGGRVPRWGKFYQFDRNTPQMKIYHNSVSHDLRWRKLKTNAWKRCRNPVLSFTQFFSFHLIENADRLLWGGKPKSKGEHNLIAVSTEKGTHRGSIYVWREYDESRRKSMLWVPSSLSRFKKDGVIDVLSHNMDLRVIWTISIFWSVTTGGRFWHQDG